MNNIPIQAPQNVIRAANYTLYRAMVYCRNIVGDSNTGVRIVYEIMNAIHEIPNILDRWGTNNNDIEKLRHYFGYFDHTKWRDSNSALTAPDLVQIFDEKLKEIGS